MRIARTIALVAVVFAAFVSALWAQDVPDLWKLRLGMSAADVQKAIGSPAHHEAFESVQGHQIYVFFYPGDRDVAAGVRAIGETPVIFENGRLVGWGRSFYQKKLDTYLPAAKPK
jgi:hypothetical protein